jgi:hypothetical protein
VLALYDQCFYFSYSLMRSSHCLSNSNASCSFCPIQASSPLQVKYADGELERLGVI